MNRSDRRRMVLATLFTLAALLSLWIMGRRGDTTSAATKSTVVGADAPATTAYAPAEPGFVGGEDAPIPPGQVDVAVPPAPGANELVGTAAFHSFPAGTQGACSTALVPHNAVLTVVNMDNGQTTHCRNVLGVAPPEGVDIVLDTWLFIGIAALADSPIPVRVTW